MCARICFPAVLLVSLAVVGCGKTSNSPVFNVAGAPTVQFNAPDMMCPESCGVKVKEILSNQPGAKEVIVDFDSKTATVAIDDGGGFDPSAAVAALVDHGFKNSSIKDGGVANASAKPPLGRVFDPEAQTRRELGAERQAADAGAVQ